MKVRFIKRDITCGHNVWIHPYAKLSGCRIGDHSQVGPDVEICRNSVLGNNVKVMSRSYLGSSVTIEDDAVVGSDVAITRQLPEHCESLRKTNGSGEHTQRLSTIVERGVAIGNGVKIAFGILIGEGAMIAEGSVVSEDVPPFTIVAGIPARVIRKIRAFE